MYDLKNIKILKYRTYYPNLINYIDLKQSDSIKKGKEKRKLPPKRYPRGTA